MSSRSNSSLSKMIHEQLVNRRIIDKNVLQAFREIDRKHFVLPAFANQAYDDNPLPIGHDQTISQPYVVAYMLQVLQLTKNDRVLEIGTGSAYQTALLAQICKVVYSMDIIDDFVEQAKEKLSKLNIRNVKLRIGNGYRGWPEESPFDKIIVSAAPAKTPETLLHQLKNGGMAIIPLGETFQTLKKYTKQGNSFCEESLIGVRFVPMKELGDLHDTEK